MIRGGIKPMPTVRKLAPEEIQTIENKGKGQRKLTEEQYDSFLAEYAVGDYGEAELGDDENRLTVRNRFKALDSSKDGQATANGTGRAQAIQPVIEEPPAPPKKKGGRPRKNP